MCAVHGRFMLIAFSTDRASATSVFACGRRYCLGRRRRGRGLDVLLTLSQGAADDGQIRSLRRAFSPTHSRAGLRRCRRRHGPDDVAGCRDNVRAADRGDSVSGSTAVIVGRLLWRPRVSRAEYGPAGACCSLSHSPRGACADASQCRGPEQYGGSECLRMSCVERFRRLSVGSRRPASSASPMRPYDGTRNESAGWSGTLGPYGGGRLPAIAEAKRRMTAERAIGRTGPLCYRPATDRGGSSAAPPWRAGRGEGRARHQHCSALPRAGLPACGAAQAAGPRCFGHRPSTIRDIGCTKKSFTGREKFHVNPFDSR